MGKSNLRCKEIRWEHHSDFNVLVHGFFCGHVRLKVTSRERQDLQIRLPLQRHPRKGFFDGETRIVQNAQNQNAQNLGKLLLHLLRLVWKNRFPPCLP